MVETYGWAVRNVTDADPAKCLSYTVGLTAHGHPEVVMTGLPPDVGTAFLNIVGEIVVHEGRRLQPGEPTTELADGPAMPVLEVLDKKDLTAVAAIYGDVSALQIVWTDSKGRLPWSRTTQTRPVRSDSSGRISRDTPDHQREAFYARASAIDCVAGRASPSTEEGSITAPRIPDLLTQI